LAPVALARAPSCLDVSTEARTDGLRDGLNATDAVTTADDEHSRRVQLDA